MRRVGYNDQRNNIDFGGAFAGWKQCFSTSAWMFISYYCKSYKFNDDMQLSEYLKDVEGIVGYAPIARRAILKFAKFVKMPIIGSSYWWLIQKEGIEEYVKKCTPHFELQFYDAGTWEQFDNALKSGPVIAGTKYLGGLPGGHIVLVVDRDEKFYYVNDPYGDATTNYKNHNGEMVAYPVEWFRLACGNSTKSGYVRFMHAK